ncbi:MarR family transcriptional regulator [Saccharomonospora azurea SZMC 14600]|uniref:MarR family winged helix-turn-helix transcriptional regulator n=1 Tax=Saccharomonospora azurea TaxID=40988 RepID=UPI000240081A|nr:MarR family transcriptional regulator [Saccharomonospora azurea]EHK86963.1 MarR family transcriptional regulator [Saccharomonospora azurea SZMC 14600]
MSAQLPHSDDAPHGSTDQVAAQLVRLVRLTARAKSRMTKVGPDSVERAAYAILFHLIDRGPQRTSQLAEMLHSDISTISRQSSTLVDHGLVERLADPGDRRASLLAATSEGRRVFETNRERLNHWLEWVLDEWSDEDRLAVNVLLRRLNDRIETCDPLAAPPRPEHEHSTDEV